MPSHQEGIVIKTTKKGTSLGKTDQFKRLKSPMADPCIYENLENCDCVISKQWEKEQTTQEVIPSPDMRH